MVQRHAMRAWQEGLNFRELVLQDKAITGRVPPRQIEAAFDLKRQLRNVNKIFARVFPEIEGEATRGKPKPEPKAAARRRS
jgi:adenylosuccinate lyase